MFIKNLKIRNFRSIVKADIDLKNLTILVGNNDVGKSNILKALNLFFNDETDYEIKFNFENDYSKYSPTRKNKAKEIIIELTFESPNNYKGNKDIIWRKVWRTNGLHEPESFTRFIDNTDFPKKSKLYAWLLNTRYVYIPAIKDSGFFKELLGKLHDSLAETIEKELRNAGDEFIGRIKSNTESMILELNEKLKLQSKIELPRNLKALFKTLDFSTNNDGFPISLSNRGDGIKTRHIPHILKFISEQLNINKRRGSPSINTIWGYEEPENNLEMLASFNLAEDFYDYSKNIQILLTTHSPAFYMLEKEKISKYYVLKEISKEAEIKEINSISTLNEEMGIMPIVAPYIKEKVSEIKTLESELVKAKKELSTQDKHIIYLEGNDEKRIFEYLIKKLNLEDKFSTNTEKPGAVGVKMQLMSYAWISGSRIFKAIGIFDNDLAGINEYKKLNEEKQFEVASNEKKVKALKLNVPKHLIRIKKNYNNFPIELEETYPPKIWNLASLNNWLEDRSVEELSNFVKINSISETLENQIDKENFSDDEKLYIFKKVPDNHKEKLSKKITEDQLVINDLEDFLLNHIIKFINT